MALIEQGILGAFRGKCGSVIGYIRNGQFCMRSMPTHYRDRRSKQQLENRSRFTLVMKTMSLVRPVITLGFSRFASDITEMNVATRENYYSLVQTSTRGLQYNFPGLILSRGPVEPLSSLIHTFSGTTLQFLWNGQSIPGAGQDNVSVVLLNANRMTMKFFHNISHRGDGTATIVIPNSWNSEEIYSYLLVERSGDWSNSVYTGTIPWNEQTTLSNPTRGSATAVEQTPSNTTAVEQTLAATNVQASNIIDPQQLKPANNQNFHLHQSAIKLLFPSPLIRDHG